jgi:pSer/pThr/pTyr-binding forkhead associated (FHA) protein
VGKVTFRSKVISRAHAKIWVETGGKFFIQDTSSSSGTFLNQVRLSLANIDSTPHEIKNGDILQFGVPYQDGKEDNFKAIKARIELGKDASIPVFQIEPFLLGPDKDQDTKDGVSPKPSDVSLATPVEWNFTNEQSDHPELSVM